MKFLISKTNLLRNSTSKILTMAQIRHRSYNEAIRALNNLQTNSQVLEKVLKERQKNVHLNLSQTKMFLERSGMTLEDLDTVPIIHVTGTKGKGSTCAFCESILRQYGLKTGFFSSPHLISATERIRLNGIPISENQFSDYFWPIYDKVVVGQTESPAYFKFLTILAFNIFWKEQVDVAVIEVGVGGMYDCTNVIRNPAACGITTLDLDHTSLLGDTLEKIAWQKSGIMKKDCTTFIDGQQTQGALNVIQNYAKDIGSPLFSVPDLMSYDWGPFPPGVLGLYGAIHHKNASLALQLTNHFLKVRSGADPKVDSSREIDQIKVADPFKLSEKDALGVRLCTWPGRNQVLVKDNTVYLLDGAHTEKSTKACRSWFDLISSENDKITGRKNVFKVLIFNATRDRKAETLLEPFTTADFDHVIFCTNFPRDQNQTDNENLTTTHSKESQRIEEHAQAWIDLQKQKVENNPMESQHNNEKEIASKISNLVECSVVPYIDDALNLIKMKGQNFSQTQVLVTGSLHLIGSVLNQVEPNLWKKEKTSQEKMDEDKLVELYQTKYSCKENENNVAHGKC